MKKKLVIIASVVIIAAAKICASEALDLEIYMQLVENGLRDYQQVQNTLKQIEYQYQSMKAQLQNLQSENFEDISSFQDAMSYVDRRISFVRNVDNTLRNTQVTVGKHSYNLDELYDIPNGLLSDANDTLTNKLTKEEKAEIWGKAGIDPRNYIYLTTFKERMNDTAKKLTSLKENVQKSVEESGKELEKIMTNIAGEKGQSTLAQAVATNGLLYNVAGNIQDIGTNLAYASSLLADGVGSNGYVPPDRQMSDELYRETKNNGMKDMEIKKVNESYFKNLKVPESMKTFYNSLTTTVKDVFFVSLMSVLFIFFGVYYAVTKDSKVLKKGVVGVITGITILYSASKVVSYVIGLMA